jgi:hypothetical protein
MFSFLTHFLFAVIAFGMFLIDGILLGQAVKEKSFLGITIMVTLTATYALMVGWLLLFSPIA